MPDDAVAVILLGGTSHVGKSTLGRALAATLGWRTVSTDALARHPGRPWTAAGPHVHRHYATLSVEELTDRQLAHYARMWPSIEALVREAERAGRGGLVFEGSGIWPDRVAELASDRIAARWLTAPEALLRDRIHAASSFDARPPAERLVIDRFLGRTLCYQARMRAAVDRSGLASIDVQNAGVVDLLARIGVAGPGPGHLER